MTAAILLSIAVAAIANAQARARLHVFAPNAAKEDVALARKTVFLELLCLGAAALAAQAWKKRKADVDDASRKRRPCASGPGSVFTVKATSQQAIGMAAMVLVSLPGSPGSSAGR